MLTYVQLRARGWVAVRTAAGLGFVAVAASRLQLAVGLGVPILFDVVVWLAMAAVALTGCGAAGVCGWTWVSDYVARHRARVRGRHRRVAS
ncbi:hypothetical protein IU459_27210 [Nocardia amamiensis]|uniref:Uncharacterized protein n=1 Tax=Nocardia amamiensis TaxID=404578 RepID=A0ABS0CX94_9NOCA|nr:hypothetical protein [Nocardia amamiensis]MBF6301206.1 hypothetical protein [Nocardia amamiensis]